VFAWSGFDSAKLVLPRHKTLTLQRRAWLQRYRALDLRFAQCIAACCLIDVGGIFLEVKLPAVLNWGAILLAISLGARLGCEIFIARELARIHVSYYSANAKRDRGHVQAVERVFVVLAAVRAMWKLRR
jgi:hypothetical protein